MREPQLWLQNANGVRWTHWRELEQGTREDRRSRIVFLLFTGEMGSGKTSHALALAKFCAIPCVLVNPGSTKELHGGLTVLRHAIDYALARKSAVILLDEIDVYARDEALMAELRQAVDGTLQLEDDAVLFLIGTSNKPLTSLPVDLLDRVLFHIPFSEQPSRAARPRLLAKEGWSVPQCMEFWKVNARHLLEEEQERLAVESKGLTPRNLQLWVQKVLIELAHYNMIAGHSDEKAILPTLEHYLGARNRLPALHDVGNEGTDVMEQQLWSRL